LGFAVRFDAISGLILLNLFLDLYIVFGKLGKFGALLAIVAARFPNHLLFLLLKICRFLGRLFDVRRLVLEVVILHQNVFRYRAAFRFFGGHLVDWVCNGSRFRRLGVLFEILKEH